MMVACLASVLLALIGFSEAYTLVKPLPNVTLFTNDIWSFKFLNYFMSSNTSVTITSEGPAFLEISDPFQAVAPTNVSLGSNTCTKAVRGNVDGQDYILMLCNSGTILYSVQFDLATKVSKNGNQVTVSGQNCTDLAFNAMTSTVILACTLPNAQLPNLVALFEYYPKNLTQKSQKTLLGLNFNQPKITIESAFANNSTSGAVFDRNTLAFGFKTFSINSSGLQEGVVYGALNVPSSIGAGVIQDFKIFKGLAYVSVSLSSGANPVLFAIGCTLNDSTTAMACSTAPANYISGIAQPAFCSIEVTAQSVYLYALTEKNLIRRVSPLSDIASVVRVDTLPFSSPVFADGRAQTVARTTGNYIFVSAVIKSSNALLWSLYYPEKGYLASYQSFVPLSNLGDVLAVNSNIDQSLPLILYTDITKQTLGCLQIVEPTLTLKGNNPLLVANTQSNVQFRVSNEFKSNIYSFKATLVNSFDAGTKLSLPPSTTVYGTVNNISIEVPWEYWGGNAPRFAAAAKSPDGLQTKISYVDILNLNFSIPSIPIQISDLRMINYETFITVSATGYKFIKCSRVPNSINITCVQLFEMNTTEKLLAARNSNNAIYLVTAGINSTNSSNNNISVRALAPDGSENAPMVTYQYDGSNGVASVRITNQMVMIDVVASEIGSSVLKFYYLTFLENQEIPANLTVFSDIAIEICPKSLIWSPKLEPSFYLESSCSPTETRSLEFSSDYALGALRNLRYSKIVVTPITSGTKMGQCISRRQIIYINYATGEIYGLDRREFSSGKTIYPFFQLGLLTIIDHSCISNNNAFQIIAQGQTPDGKTSNVLVTYRTDILSSVEKRVHSIITLTGQPSQVASSVNPYNDDIYTLISSSNLQSAQAFGLKLDSPLLLIDTRDIFNPLQTSQNGVIAASMGITNQTQATNYTLPIMVAYQNDTIGATPASSTKQALKSGESFNLDNIFKLSGFHTGFSLTGSGLGNSKLTERISWSSNSVGNQIGTFVGVMAATGGVVFAWDPTSVQVIENGASIATYRGVYVGSPRVLYVRNSTDSAGKPFFFGMSKISLTNQVNIFAVFKSPDAGVWRVAMQPFQQGAEYLKVFVVNPDTLVFAYVLQIPESDSVMAGTFNITFDSSLSIYKINLLQNATLVRTDQKLGQVHAFNLKKAIRVFYGQRNDNNNIYYIHFDPLTLQIKSQGQIATPIGSEFSTELNLMRCTETVPGSTSSYDSANINSLTVLCYSTSKAFNSYAFYLNSPEDTVSGVPSVGQITTLQNIQGFDPVAVKLNSKFLMVISRRSIGALPASNNFGGIGLLNENVTVTLYNPSTFSCIQSYRYSLLNVALLQNSTDPLDGDLIPEDNRFVLTLGQPNQMIRTLQISSLMLSVDKDVTLDPTKLSLRISGYSSNQDTPFANAFVADSSLKWVVVTFIVVTALIILGGVAYYLIYVKQMFPKIYSRKQPMSDQDDSVRGSRELHEMDPTL